MSGRGGFRENAGRKRKPEGQKPKISVTLSKEAIASLDQSASARGISRSELVEQYARSGCGENQEAIEALKEAVLFHLVSTSGCAPDRLNPELILDSLKRLQEAFERVQSKG